MTKKTVLVSGAGGFLGKEVVKQLLEKEISTIALTSTPDILINTFNSHKNLTVLNINEWVGNLDKSIEIDTFINCSFPRTSNPDQLAEGINFTKELIENILNFNVGNIINISSQSVYSQKNKITPDESASVAPSTLYGMAKYASEKVVSALCDNYSKRKVNYSNIRLASLTGKELETRMINKFVKLALVGEEVIVNGTGQKVSYLDVRDAASALVVMVNKNVGKWSATYNLGNNKYYSVLEIAELVNDVAKKKNVPGIKIILKEEMDDFNNLINSKLFYGDFEWHPTFDIKMMIEELFDYYMSIE